MDFVDFEQVFIEAIYITIMDTTTETNLAVQTIIAADGTGNETACIQFIKSAIGLFKPRLELIRRFFSYEINGTGDGVAPVQCPLGPTQDFNAFQVVNIHHLRYPRRYVDIINRHDSGVVCSRAVFLGADTPDGDFGLCITIGRE